MFTTVRIKEMTKQNAPLLFLVKDNVLPNNIMSLSAGSKDSPLTVRDT